MADVPVYHGKFGEREATRLLWRAGFGPRPGEAASSPGASTSRARSTRSPARAARERLKGPEPVDDDGLPIAPFDAYGPRPALVARPDGAHQPPAGRADGADLARLVRDRRRQLRSGSRSSRRSCSSSRGSARSHDLLLAVTTDPAMLIWLSGSTTRGSAPNENYGREMMELFTLGASDASGYPVLRGRRPRAGAGADRLDARPGSTTSATTNFRFDPKRHDAGVEDDLRRRPAPSTGPTRVRLCVDHPAHKGFFVDKLWSYFIPTPPPAKTREALERPLRQARLRDPARGRGDPHAPRLLPRARRWSSRRSSTSPACCAPAAAASEPTGRGSAELAGQRLFRPPNVAGWDDDPLARHLDLPRPLDRRQRDRRLRRDRRRGRLRRRRERRSSPSTGRCASGATRRSAAATRKCARALRRARSAPPRPPTGSRRPSARCARTRCGC